MDSTDLDALKELLDEYASASRETTDRFRSPGERLDALHRRRRVEAELMERFPPPG
jgi:hypothetical protein